MQDENADLFLGDGDDVVARAELLLAKMGADAATSAPLREFATNASTGRSKGLDSGGNRRQRQHGGIGHRERKGNEEKEQLMEDKYYGADGGLMDRSIRGTYQVTSGTYREREFPPSQALLSAERNLLSGLHDFKCDPHCAMAQCLEMDGQPGEEDTWKPYGNWDTIDKYIGLCKEFQQNLIVSDQYTGVVGADGESLHLQEERESWLLLSMLHAGLGTPLGNTPPICPQNEVNIAYYHDKQLQLWNVVARWFHRVAAERNQKSDRASTHQPLQGAYLPCTVAALKETTPSGSSSRDADPDASWRGQLNVHADDLDDQISLLERLWQLVLEGAFSVEVDGHGKEQDELRRCALELCIEYGEPWRCAALSGARPMRPKPDAPNVRQGNVYRSVWSVMTSRAARRLAHKASELEQKPSGRMQARAARYESAILAAVSGDLECLKESPLCRGDWRRLCWSSFRSMVNARFDVACAENRRRLSNELSHVPGPASSDYEQELLKRAGFLKDYNERNVFAQAQSKVPQSEQQFFSVQRALIEGNFHQLLCGASDEHPEEDLCQLLCGPNWGLLNILTVGQVCGFHYVAANSQDAAAMGTMRLDQEAAAEAALDRAPCWQWENRTLAIQLLRFVAHASIYMSNLITENSVVDESEPPESIKQAAEAVVLAYVRFLLTDKSSNILQRYQAIPVFYLSFCSSEHLPVAVQAALMEASAIATDDATNAILDKWQLVVKPAYLIPQAARQALRNVRRQWQQNEPPSELVGTALEQVRLACSSTGLQEKSHSEEVSNARDRLLNTWKWLAKRQLILSTWTEALAQANQIFRDLVCEALAIGSFVESTPGSDSALNLARSFLQDYVFPAHEEHRQQLEAAKQSGQPTAQEWPMSDLNLESVKRELECWELFLRADEYLQEWQSNMEWLRQQSSFKEELVNEMSSFARKISVNIRDVLTFTGGWLVEGADASKTRKNVDQNQAVPKVLLSDPITSEELTERAQLIGQRHKPGDLRKACVVYLVHSYIDTLTEAAHEIEVLQGMHKWHQGANKYGIVVELYHEAIQIADVVAEESLDLKHCFTIQDMARLLEKLRQCSNQLLRLDGTLSRLHPIE